jgi:sialate O-acetylesterase
MAQVRLLTFLLLFSLAILTPASLHATLRLPAVFGDHMVLQAGKPDAIWGWDDPGTQVDVTFTADKDGAATKASATAGADGRWSVTLGPLTTGTAGKIEVSTDHHESQTAHDVLVGEVWLGSGQSNMGYTIGWATAPPDKLATAKTEAAADDGQIRYFGVTSLGAETPQDDVKGSWVVVTPDNVGQCSAVAWNFAVILREHLHCPFGLIVSAAGGTPVEAWISKPTLDATSVGAAVWKRHTDALGRVTPEAQAKFDAELAAWKAANPTALLKGLHSHDIPPEPYSPSFRMVPVRLYNGKIHGLAPYTLKGILWFQADGNERHPEEYGELIRALITSWRAEWHDDLPFYYVEENNIHDYQTAPVEPSGLAWVRDAENGALELPGVDVATSVDIGLGSEAHFPNKKEVGRRLAGLALNNLYGEPGLVHSPQFAGFKIEGDKIRVTLKYADGLRARNNGPLNGFAIRGADGKWQWAQAKIDGQDLILSNDQIPEPVAVRYAWAANPIISVENEAGLPLRPFRTDSDPMVPYAEPKW